MTLKVDPKENLKVVVKYLDSNLENFGKYLSRLEKKLYFRVIRVKLSKLLISTEFNRIKICKSDIQRSMPRVECFFNGTFIRSY